MCRENVNRNLVLVSLKIHGKKVYNIRNTTESGRRKLNENKALTSKKAKIYPNGKNNFFTCRICVSSIHQQGSHYHQGCAYKKSICALHGKKKNYKDNTEHTPH
uniref:Cysteine-rich PDZ-binding protein n=1 Tax=Prolemur simus TaxID=1328070 RepID=A0A8C8ZG71_PROSS